MSAHTPDRDARDLTDDVPEADAADQRMSIGSDDADLPEEMVELVDDADPADVWEQSQTVSFEEDEREGD